MSGLRAGTYSIVARDPATGELGVAVQSHWFSVGSIVTWAEAGVGAVATQSLVDPAYGPKGLDLMRQGVPAPKALEQLVAADAGRNGRQVAMIDATGAVNAYTGSGAIAAAGHHVGAQYSVQANMMGKPTVWPAMAKAFEAATGSLADRLIAALEAAEGEGGDVAQFLDHHDVVGPDRRLDGVVGRSVDRRAVLDAPVLGVDGRHVGVEHLEELRARPGRQGDGGKHVNHARQYTQAFAICEDAPCAPPLPPP